MLGTCNKEYYPLSAVMPPPHVLIITNNASLSWIFTECPIKYPIEHTRREVVVLIARN